MTISSTSRIAGPYTGTGSQFNFSFAFKVFANTDVLVVLTDPAGNNTTQVLTSQYTVALNADQNASPGGTVTMLVAPPTGYMLTISSQVPLLQPTNLANVGNFYPSAITDALDRLTIQVQQQQVALNGTLVAPISDASTAPLALPSKAARAGYFLAFDSNGNPVTATFSIAGMIALSAQTQAAAAAAATSATQSAASATQSAASAASAANTALSINTTLSSVTGTPYVFSADGSTTIFTLPVAGLTPSMLSVHVAGTYIQKSAYSVVGAQVIFNTAPGAGTNNVEIFAQANTQLLTQLSADYGSVTGTVTASADYGLLH